MSTPSRPWGDRAPAPARVSTFTVLDPMELALIVGELSAIGPAIGDAWPGDAYLISTRVEADLWPDWTDDVRFGLADDDADGVSEEGGRA